MLEDVSIDWNHIAGTCPGHPRLSCRTKDVDARDKPRDKPAHDEDTSWRPGSKLMTRGVPKTLASACLRAAVVTALTLLMHGAGTQDRPAQTKVRLVVGGKSAIFYLPLSVTERLGYFKERGIDVEIADVQSGARARSR
jgi:hypothetical protein